MNRVNTNKSTNLGLKPSHSATEEFIVIISSQNESNYWI